ncbi:MAG: hypothetical protein OEM83_00520 [Gammaproteobacteria bacterium]|nr:hypothetical protein [Gammaproteobacteria bacterium]MDH5512456.1 hypothetical protein [Gammaproteobacteria bacterium]
MRLLPVIFILAVALGACGEKKDVKDTVFAPAVEAKDKARAVEDRLREGAEKNRETLKASEQGGAADQRIEGY